MLYPGPAAELGQHVRRYGGTSTVDTETFWHGMRPGEAVGARIEPGKTLVVRLVAVGEAGSDDRRTLHLEMNGTWLPMAVIYPSVGVGATARPATDPATPTRSPSPWPAGLDRLAAERGAAVEPGEAVVVIEAMKTETVVRAPHGGQVTALPVVAGDSVGPGDLLAVVLRG